RLLSSGDGAALHLIHDVDGSTEIFEALADRLGAAVRVYGIGPRAEAAFPILHTRIEEMAAHYAAKIRQVQARGPYRVGGLGIGGVLAHAVACRLEAEGEQVALVALFDSVDAAQRPARAWSSGLFPKVERGLAERLRAGTAKLSTNLTRSGVDY